MKKLLVIAILFSAISLSPGLSHAQQSTSTRADLAARVPHLVSILSMINNTFTYIQARMNLDNNLLGQHATTLQATAVRLRSASTTPVTTVEASNISDAISLMQAHVAAIVSWRAQVSTSTASISRIIGNISSIISSTTGVLIPIATSTATSTPTTSTSTATSTQSSASGMTGTTTTTTTGNSTTITTTYQ